MDDSHKGANERIHALSFDSLQPGISEPQVQQPLRHKSAIDVQSKLYQSDVVQRISEIDLSFKSIAPPFVVELDTTAACDLACPGCISEDIIAKGGRFSNQRLLELGEELIAADIRAVILIGGGEPLAHPRIADLIQLLGENEIAIGLTTNGTFIDRHVEQISRYCSWTRVSIDAATKETFDTLRPSKRGRSKWQTVIENTERLAKMDRKGLVGFSFLVQSPADGPGIKCNAMEIYDAAVLAKELGCDYFEVKPTYEFRGDVPHALVKHSLDARSVAEEQIARLNDLESDTFHIYQAINMAASIEGVDKDQPKNYDCCPAAMLRTLITPSGAFVCPYWRGKEEFKIGDPVAHSFQEIWSGLKRMDVMTSLKPSKDCNFHCLRHVSNQTVLAIKDSLDNEEKVDTVVSYDPFI